MSEVAQANLVIWIFAIILVGYTFLQSGLFVRRALQFNRKHQLLSKKDLRDCVKIGTTAAIAPGVNTVFLAISMMSLVGPGLMFMRFGIIGSPAFELRVLQQAASVAEINLDNPMTADYLTYFVFAGAVGVMCLIPAPVFTLRAMEMGGRKRAEKTGKPNIIMRALPKVSVAIMGLLGYEYATASLQSGVAYFVGLIMSIVIYTQIGHGRKKLAPWALLIATVCGITCGQIAAAIAGV